MRRCVTSLLATALACACLAYPAAANVVTAPVAAPEGAAAPGAEVPSIDAEITVPGWWVVGPFLSGVREAGVDPLAFDSEAPAMPTPLLRSGFPSALVPGGMARWRYYQSGADGVLAVDYPEVPEASMKLVTDEWGGSGGNTMGLAYATLDLPGPRRALLDLRQAGSVSINGVPWPGDAYGNGMGMQPVLLPGGRVELKVAISAGQRFSLKFLPVPSDIQVFTQSATLPDLVRGEAAPQYIGVPVANNTTRWITLNTPKLESKFRATLQILNVKIPPLCVANLVLKFIPFSDVVPADLEGDKLPMFLTLNYDGGYIEVMLEPAVKNADQPRKVTFLSAMDGSVQYYGLLPPKDFDPARQYGLILSLHGAGVDAIGQASAYQPKDWAYVAAPTNRRPYGFDWQDWGQQDMLEVLAQVERTCRIDENRVHLTGHSMGGHGTWLNALTFPGLWASAAPSAGWTRFDLYAPMFLRKNLLLGEPRANYIWQLALRQDDTLALCENARNLPIYALEGGADDNVPPQQPRLLVERLRQLGYDVTYREVPGMGHWWDDPKTPGTDCVDSAELNAFWKSHVRDPWPPEVVLRTSNYAVNNQAYWLMGWPELPGEDMVIRAKAEGGTVNIRTVNTAALLVQLSSKLLTTDHPRLVIDGEVLDPGQVAHLDNYVFRAGRRNGRWELSGDIPLPLLSREKAALGRMKSVLMTPCRVVVGTSGTPEENEWSLQLARLYAWHWWYRANGSLCILTDTDALADSSWGGSYISLGAPISNFFREAQAQATGSPVGGVSGGLTVGDRYIPGDDLSFMFITPVTSAGGTSLCLVAGGTSLKALKRLPAMMGIYSGSGFPDWMVWDDEVKLKGQAGMLGMGFFDLNWQIDPALSYFNEDLIARRMP